MRVARVKPRHTRQANRSVGAQGRGGGAEDARLGPMLTWRTASLATIALAAVACGRSHQVAAIDPADPPYWLSATYLGFYAMTRGGADRDNCPSAEDDGTTITLVGEECEALETMSFRGRMTYPRAAEELLVVDVEGAMTFEGWTIIRRHPECPELGDRTFEMTLDGVITSQPIAPRGTRFTIDVTERGEEVVDDCELREVDRVVQYAGELLGEPEHQVWNGSGVWSDIDGRFEAETVDQVFDEAICVSEALSGFTRVRGESEAVFTYDGATDCDEDSTVTWTLDGEPQGELSGVSCAVGRLPGSRGPAALVLGGLFALAWRGRRRRRSC